MIGGDGSKGRGGVADITWVIVKPLERKLMDKIKHSIVIVVDENQYNMYGNNTTFLNRIWSIYLAKLIKEAGGISDTVAPGTYDFYITRKGLTVYSHLTPQEA